MNFKKGEKYILFLDIKINFKAIKTTLMSLISFSIDLSHFLILYKFFHLKNIILKIILIFFKEKIQIKLLLFYFIFIFK